MWFVLGVIAFSVLLEPKSETGFVPVLIEAIAFASFFLPAFCLRYGGLSVLGEKIELIPVLGILLIFLVDFCCSWINIVCLLIAKIRKKKECERERFLIKEKTRIL